MGNIHVGLCPDIIKWGTIPVPDESSHQNQLQISKPTHTQRELPRVHLPIVAKILSPWSVDIEEKLINLSEEISAEILLLQGLSESVEFQTNCLCWRMGGCQNCPTS